MKGAAATDALCDAPALTLTASDMTDGRVADKQAEAAEAHGSVLRGNIPLGPDAGPCVHLIGASAAETVLLSQHDAFSSALGWRPLLGTGLGEAILNVDPPTHGEQRREAGPALANTFVQQYSSKVIGYVDDALETLLQRGTVDAYAFAQALAFRAVAGTIGGVPESEIDPIFRLLRVILDGYDYETESRDAFLARAALARQAFRDHLLGIVAERRRGRPRDPVSLLDLLLEKRRDATAESDAQIVSFLSVLLIAGHDTGATMYARALYLLAAMPDVAGSIAAELLAAGWTDERALSVEVIDRSPMLDRFMLEVGRLYPPLINLPHVTLRDVEIGGYRIASGTRIALGIGASQRLPSVFHDPCRFDLSRYDDPERVRQTRPFLMLTFSGGARMCMGMRFAQIEFKAIVARVVTRLRLVPVDPSIAIAHAGMWAGRPSQPMMLECVAAPA